MATGRMPLQRVQELLPGETIMAVSIQVPYTISIILESGLILTFPLPKDYREGIPVDSLQGGGDD